MNKNDDYTHILQKLDYTFKNPKLLEEAFRHASYVNERAGGNLRDNERLEFLGDAVLDLAISHILMDFFEDAKEGDLSKYRAAVVHERALCLVAEGLQLGGHLWLGKGEELSNGRQKPSIRPGPGKSPQLCLVRAGAGEGHPPGLPLPGRYRRRS